MQVFLHALTNHNHKPTISLMWWTVQTNDILKENSEDFLVYEDVECETKN